MGDLENDELLPNGWRVEVRVRKNGKKDKCYFAPSNGLKFNSMVGVFRYLNNKSEETVKGPTKQFGKKIITEKDVAEGLPPGWIKEIKVTKTGHKVRRDPYYIDPVSGYRFRSMKDAVRYLETGKIGRLAYKPKDKDSHDEGDLEDDKYNSPTAAKKQKLVVQGTETDNAEHRINLSEQVKNEDALDPVNTRECISFSEHTSGGAGTESRGSSFSEAKYSGMDGGKDSDKKELLSNTEVGVLPYRQSSETGETKDETAKTTTGKRRSRKKKVLDLPRRASKRLAGLALNPTPELKTSNRTRQTVVKLSDDVAASTDEGSCSDSRSHQALWQLHQLEAKPEANIALETSNSTEVLTESSKSKHPSGNPNGHAEKIETEYKSDKKQGCAFDSPLKNQDRIETDSNADEKSGPPIDLPFGDLLSDPCIAFAIKTLTGVTFKTSSDKEVSLESNNSKAEGLATWEEYAGKQTEIENNKKQENLATPDEHAANDESYYKTDENLGNPLDLPFADIWRDPCIEFAIKTLTGTIPVGCDLDMQDYIQHQLESSQTQASNNFCQTEFLCQQYDSLEKPVSGEQARTGNLSLQNSAGASFHQQSKKRCNECH